MPQYWHLANFSRTFIISIVTAVLASTPLAASGQTITPLTLLPGEELLPLAEVECAVLYSDSFSEGDRESLRKHYSEWKWQGACRFGLAHGPGIMMLTANYGIQQTFIYGFLFSPRYVFSHSRGIANFYGAKAQGKSGRALMIYSVAPATASVEGLLADLKVDTFLILFSVDQDGKQVNQTIAVRDYQNNCAGDYWVGYEAVRSKVRPTCNKNGPVMAVVREDVYPGKPDPQKKILEVEPCKLGTSQCANAFRKLLGKDAALVDAIIRDDDIHRKAYITSLFTRMEPMERALAERAEALAAKAGAGR